MGRVWGEVGGYTWGRSCLPPVADELKGGDCCLRHAPMTRQVLVGVGAGAGEGNKSCILFRSVEQTVAGIITVTMEAKHARSGSGS